MRFEEEPCERIEPFIAKHINHRRHRLSTVSRRRHIAPESARESSSTLDSITGPRNEYGICESDQYSCYGHAHAHWHKQYDYGYGWIGL